MSTPRSIEFDEVRVGDEIRAERTDGFVRAYIGTLDGTGCDFLSFVDGRSIVNDCGWSLTLLSRPTEVCLAGSLWQDPETGNVWVQYVAILGAARGGTLSGQCYDSFLIERLVPWSPAGTV